MQSVPRRAGAAWSWLEGCSASRCQGLGLLPPCPPLGHLLAPKQGSDIWAAGRGYSRTQFIFAKLLITVQDLVSNTSDTAGSSQSPCFTVLHQYQGDSILLFLPHHYAFKNDQITVSRRSHPWNGISLRERQFPTTTVCKSQRSDSITLHFAIYNLLVFISAEAS